MGLISLRPGASVFLRVRGFLILAAIILLLLALGFGIVKLIALPFGGVGTGAATLLGLLVVIAVLGVLALLGRRRQAKARQRT